MIWTLALVGCVVGDVHPEDTGDTGVEEWTPSEEDEADWEALLDFAAQEVEDEGVPGAALAVVIDGRLAFSGGVGLKDPDLDPSDPDAAPTGDTVFWVASITKMVTAAAVLSAEEEGLLDLDAPLPEAFGDFHLAEGYDPDSVSLHQLLSHTSGIPDGLEYSCHQSLSAWWADQEEPLWSPPGRLWNYTNMGYSLAGAALETVDGRPFGEAVDARVFTPLGMDTATFDADEALSLDYATGSATNAIGMPMDVVPGTYDCAVSQPPGFLWASVDDYAHFAEALLDGGGEALSPESVGAMTSVHAHAGWWPTLDYGYGLFVDQYKELDVLWHDGGIEGFRTTWYLVPEQDFAVVVFVNNHHYSPATIAWEAMDLFLEPEAEQPDWSTPASTWGVYEGTYEDPFTLGRIDVVHTALGLRATLHRFGSECDLVQYGGDSFFMQVQGYWMLITFALDEAGRGEYLVSRVGVAERVEDEDESRDPAAPAAELPAPPPLWTVGPF